MPNNLPSWSTECHSLVLSKGYYSEYPSLLQARGSLTAALNALSSRPVHVNAQTRPHAVFPQEAARLSTACFPSPATRSTAPYWIREAWLYGGNSAHSDSPWVFGRTILPLATFKRHATALQHIQDTALGTVLFKHTPPYRTPFQYATLYPNHILYHCARNHLPEKVNTSPCPYLWARQSLLYWQAYPLLITEVFFPSLIQFCVKRP